MGGQSRGKKRKRVGQGRDHSPLPFKLLMRTARVNIIPWNLHHRSDPASFWSPRSTHTISMKLKFEGMDIIVNLILSACLPFFSLSLSLPHKLILYIFDFEVARREASQNTLGTLGFNQYASAQRKYVGSRNGFDILSAILCSNTPSAIYILFLYRRTSQISSHWSSYCVKCSMNSPQRCRPLAWAQYIFWKHSLWRNSVASLKQLLLFIIIKLSP